MRVWLDFMTVCNQARQVTCTVQEPKQVTQTVMESIQVTETVMVPRHEANDTEVKSFPFK